MVKKRLERGEPCSKCAEADALLERRGLSSRIDRIVWADEGDPSSEGMVLGRRYNVDVAPFYIIEEDGNSRVETSTLRLISSLLAPVRVNPAESDLKGPPLAAQLLEELSDAPISLIVERAMRLSGGPMELAFSGAEDVVLIDVACRIQKENPNARLSVFCLDTGRLHSETYRYIDQVRKHYGIEIEMALPERAPVEAMVRQKGLFSFYEDGHKECCGVRKVSALRRVLADAGGWMTGQRRDQSPTRSDVAIVEWDAHHGPGGLLKFNPLARWSIEEVWQYIRSHGVPYNELHDRGYISIGCEPCTRPIRPGEHPRAGRWWWEEATQRECGLHVPSKGWSSNL
jgi:phosphoadenosine phosphosulfate reductase